MFSNDDISKYYDVSEVHYRRVWDLERSRSLHYGYWDKTVTNFHEALLNINRLLAEYAGIKEGDRVLDAGCGVGGSSLWLAKEKNCSVTGISLNKRQIEKATASADALGLSGSVLFEQKDYLNTSYADHSFDIVWAIESVCYASEKSLFINEAFRILRPGGKLIIADFFKTKDLGGKDAALVTEWAHCWAINDFSTIEEFESKLIKAHFSDLKIFDATEGIIPSAKKLYRSYFLGALGAKIYALFKPNATLMGKKNVYNAYLQYKTLKKGLWKYLVVKAVK